MAETIHLTDRDDVRALVREKYGAAALTVEPHNIGVSFGRS
jgi:hypothetical protein